MRYCIFVLLVASLCFGSLIAGEAGVVLNVGDEAPAFSALDDKEEQWNSSDHVGENIVVIYFYPAAMTGGCTQQACGFRDDRDALMELGAEVVGVSGDAVENLRVFKQVHNLNFTLLYDRNGEIAKSFGVPVREGGSITRTMGEEEVQLVRDVTTARWTFVIGLDGRIVYKNTEVRAAEDSKEILAMLRDTSESSAK